ncbi:MAG: cytochrome c maturation protein CcmE [Bdellovibrionales bacterium]|nr:cytochrome c maturation protein CcmE [Bdellovibrionales bacterium]
MNARFLFAIGVVVAVLATLIYSASSSTAKAVVTVDELLQSGAIPNAVRLGARVSEGGIEYRTQPNREVRFAVHDIPKGTGVVSVVYEGAMPDTLKIGRDVILEGKYDGEHFVASSLMTQCPSKYEPPVPGAGTAGAGTAGVEEPRAENAGTEGFGMGKTEKNHG